MIRPTHVACHSLRFDTREQLALHWNRFHVAAVPVFTCPDKGCDVRTTVCTDFYRHWVAEHSLMRLDSQMLDRIVGLAVNPYYCHNAARDVPGETATRPTLLQAMGRSPFDAEVQWAFRDHVKALQDTLVRAGAGLYSVVTCTPTESKPGRKLTGHQG